MIKVKDDKIKTLLKEVKELQRDLRSNEMERLEMSNKEALTRKECNGLALELDRQTTELRDRLE